MPFTKYLIDDSVLPPRHRELLILRAAWLCGNQYLWSTHAALAQKTQYSARTLCVQPTFIAKYESLWDLVCSIAYLPFPERAYTDLV